MRWQGFGQLLEIVAWVFFIGLVLGVSALLLFVVLSGMLAVG